MTEIQDKAQIADKRVSTRLHELRVSKGLSQQELADMIGVTYQQAYKYEKGINRLSAGRLAMVSDALEVPVSYFFEETTSSTDENDDLNRISMKAARKFREIDPVYQEAVYGLIRAIAEYSNNFTNR